MELVKLLILLILLLASPYLGAILMWLFSKKDIPFKEAINNDYVLWHAVVGNTVIVIIIILLRWSGIITSSFP